MVAMRITQNMPNNDNVLELDWPDVSECVTVTDVLDTVQSDKDKYIPVDIAQVPAYVRDTTDTNALYFQRKTQATVNVKHSWVVLEVD